MHGRARTALARRPDRDSVGTDFAATVLLLRPVHIAEIHGLPFIHQDPFDRALIAQATVEDLVLVTTDEEIAQYASRRLRIIR